MAKPPTASEAIAAAVRKYRQMRGWSVRELSEKCAELGATTLTQASLTNIERGLTAKEGRGSRTVTVDELLVLSMALGVPAAALMFPFGEHSEIAVSPMFAWPVLDAFRWFIGGDAARGLIPPEIRWAPEPTLFKSSTRAMRRLAEIEHLRTSAEATRDLLYGDPDNLLSARHHLEVAWRNAKPAMRKRMEEVADENNRPRPGLPIPDEEYVSQWRERLPATYESRLRAYASGLRQAVESGDLQVPPPVPAALYDDLMALPAEEHLEDLASEKQTAGVPIPARPILPPGIKVARPERETADGER
ncbi:hypothetical protein ACIBBG_16445 [Micromonospora chersina]|uniref:hypothetical protein n=1 Tax=Micromonospora chersina TaxID=47854 RepID=UPI0037A2E0C0